MSRKEILESAFFISREGFEMANVCNNIDCHNMFVLRNAWNRDIEMLRAKIENVKVHLKFDFGDQEDFMSQSVYTTSLPTRVKSLCDKHGFDKVGDLFRFGRTALSKSDNIGDVSLLEVDRFFESGNMGREWKRRVRRTNIQIAFDKQKMVERNERKRI